MELATVCDIGRLRKDEILKNGGTLLDIFVENPNDTGAYNTVLEITLDKDFHYTGIKVTECREDFILKYLYKKGSSNGTDFSPTAKITIPKRTLKNKVIASFKESVEEYKDHQQNSIIKNILKELEKNEEKILKDIKENFELKKKSVLTVVYTDLYVGDFEIFRDKFLKDSIKNYYLIDKKESKGKDKDCSICRKEKNEVYGNVNIFKFYTVDKKGYVAGGFKKIDSWRNFPVCKECSIELELGKRYLDQKLKFKFQGRDFYLIPKLIYQKDLMKILNILSNLENECIEDQYETVEEMLMKRLSKIENYVTFDLLFFEVNNSAMNIKLDVEEILPSRFRKIHENMTILNDLFRKSTKSEKIRLNFGFLSNLFPRKTHNKYFLEVMDIILSNKGIEYKFIINHLKNHIVQKFSEEEGKFFYYETIKAYSFLMYLRLLNVLWKEKGQVRSMSKFEWNIKDYDSKEGLFENFFDENMDFFTTPDKRAVFLIGFLSQKLINIQYKKESRTPFINRLKGLKLGQKDMRRLLPEIQNKLIEYDASYYKDIQALTSMYILQAGEKWSISELDIPFYFSLGMNLERHIILFNKEENDDE